MEEEVVEAALPPAQDDDVVNTWWAGHIGHIRTGDAKILSDIQIPSTCRQGISVLVSLLMY